MVKLILCSLPYSKPSSLTSHAAASRHTERGCATCLCARSLLAARFRVARVLPYQNLRRTPLINKFLLTGDLFRLPAGLRIYELESLVARMGSGCAAYNGGRARAARLAVALAWQRHRNNLLYRLFALGHVFNAQLWRDPHVAFATSSSSSFSLTLGVFTGLFAAVFAQAIKRFGGWAILSAPVIWAARANGRGL